MLNSFARSLEECGFAVGVFIIEFELDVAGRRQGVPDVGASGIGRETAWLCKCQSLFASAATIRPPPPADHICASHRLAAGRPQWRAALSIGYGRRRKDRRHTTLSRAMRRGLGSAEKLVATCGKAPRWPSVMQPPDFPVASCGEALIWPQVVRQSVPGRLTCPRLSRPPPLPPSPRLSTVLGYTPEEDEDAPTGGAPEVPAPDAPTGTAAPVGEIVGALFFEDAV